MTRRFSVSCLLTLAMAWVVPSAVPLRRSAAAASLPPDSSPSPSSSPFEAQRLRVDIRGPVAVVELDRPLRLGRREGQAYADEIGLDLALPPRARVVEAVIEGDRTRMRLGEVTGPVARKAYGDLVALAKWRRTPMAVQEDEGADLRLLLAGPDIGRTKNADRLRLRLRYVAPLGCRGGDLVLPFPAALDASPAPIAVELRFDLGSGAPAIERVSMGDVEAPVAGRSRRTFAATVPTDRGFEVILTPRDKIPSAGFALAAVARSRAGASFATLVCRPLSRQTTPRPFTRALYVLDRSRSMGPAGAAAAGALSRALALALPPGLRIGAVAFDEQPEPVFPVFRAATLETLSALESALAAGSLRNGSRLREALGKAGELLARERGERKGAAQGSDRRDETLLVVLTDGALPADHDRAGIERILSQAGLGELPSAVVVLREADDERPAPSALRALAAPLSRAGGVLRAIDPIGAADKAADIVTALSAGGDLVDLEGPTAAPFDALAVAPGQGALAVGRVRAVPGEVVVKGRLAGRARRLRAAPVAIAATDAAAVAALTSSSAPTWRLLPGDRGPDGAGELGDERAALLTASLPSGDRAVRGELDRDVVKRALGYAYLPRARACYVTRSIKTAGDFALRGRLRLELQLERGEVVGADITRSTLGQRDLERCLREAAFRVEVPRPVRADVPVIAALNLVFRPRSDAVQGRPTSADAGAFDKEIDRVLGPPGPVGDPLELLIEDDARRLEQPVQLEGTELGPR